MNMLVLMVSFWEEAGKEAAVLTKPKMTPEVSGAGTEQASEGLHGPALL